MIYYRDKILNNLFEDKINSDLIQKDLNYISQNSSVGEDDIYSDIVYRAYNYGELNLLDSSNKNEQEKTGNDKPSENNVGIPSEIEKASNAVQAVEHNINF